MAFVGRCTQLSASVVVAWFDAALGTNLVFSMEVPVIRSDGKSIFSTLRFVLVRSMTPFLFYFILNVSVQTGRFAYESSLRNKVHTTRNHMVQTGSDAGQSMLEVSPWAPRNSQGTSMSPFYDIS